MRKHYVGLDEWIVMHRGPDGYYCVREDGRKQIPLILGEVRRAPRGG